MIKKSVSRRGALRAVGLAGSAGVLAACGETITVTKEVPVEVIKEVQVAGETIVKEVEVEKIVEKEVQVEVVVEKEVEVEVVVEKEVERIVEVQAKSQSAKITYWMQQWDDGVAAFAGAIDSFHAAYPQYEIEMVPIGYGDLFAKFYPAITTETSSEVVYSYSNWWYPIDVTKVLHPMTPTLRSRSEFLGIFYQGALDTVASRDGQFYVVPLICGMGGPIIMIDDDRAAELGVNPDTFTNSYEELEEAWQKGTTKDGDRLSTGGVDIAWSRAADWMRSHIQQMTEKSSYYSKETEKFTFNNDAGLAAMNKITQPLMDYQSRELIADAAGNALAKGTHLTEANGLWKVSSYGNAFPDLNLSPHSIPDYPGAKQRVLEGDGVATIAIPKFVQGAKLEAAQAFMIHLWQPENLAAFGKFYSGSHAVKAVYDNPEFLATKWGGIGAKFVPDEVWPYYHFVQHHVATLNGEMAGPIEKVTFDGMDPSEALQTAEDRANTLNQEALDRFKAG
jgi:ABC-type glycerol-3-phosphate transport system substrate-binding protein